MFEYLMPSLVMRAPAGSLLEQTSRLVVREQMNTALSARRAVGRIESAYNARDLELTYQYSSFGVPGLGLEARARRKHRRRALCNGACGDGRSARRGAQLLASGRIGGRGRYGWYEALDYTPGPSSRGTKVAIVRAYMAHHQGMSVIAIADALHDGAMRRAFTPNRSSGQPSSSSGTDAARRSAHRRTED